MAAGEVRRAAPRQRFCPGVIRLRFRRLLNGKEKLKDRQVARIEAEELARWLKEQGPEKAARTPLARGRDLVHGDWLRTTAAA